MNMNQCIFVGRLTKEVELRYTPNGVAVASFTIAIDRPFSSSNNNNKPETDFANVVCWRALAENVANHVVKGQEVGVKARMQTRSFEDGSGNRRSVTEFIAEDVQFGQKPRSYYEQQGGSQSQQQSSNSRIQQTANDPLFGNVTEVNDDKLPF